MRRLRGCILQGACVGFHESKTPPDVEFDDWLVNLFWSLHRFKWLQWLVLLLIRVREKFDLHRFIKKPITKEVDDMDNCHFRTLYKQNTFNDNFTDPDFLCSMQLNTNLNYYTLGEAILATIRVALHVCPCIFYFIMYYHLSYENVLPETVFGITMIFTVFGYAALAWCQWSSCSHSSDMIPETPTSVSTWSFLLETIINEKLPLVWNDLLVSLCCGGFSYLLVPILRTVTQSVDIRTVYAVCTIMFGVHLFCNDYGLKVALVSKALSMNSAIFSVICLASRLQTDEHCLALMAFGVMSFICYPQWGHSIQKRFENWTTPTSVILMIIATSAGSTVSWGLSAFIIAINLMIVVVSPVLYIYYVQYKVNILGPWDEARPELHVDMEEIERGFEIRKNKRGTLSEESIGNLTARKVEKANVDQCLAKKRNEEENIAQMEAKGIGKVL